MTLPKLKDSRYIIFFLLVISACITVRQNPVGERQLYYQDVSRKSWTENAPRPLTVTVWYPAKAGTAERQTSVAIFKTGLSARGAEISPLKEKYPLVVLSHGTGGSAASIAWLGKKLSRRGYIAAAVNHHGNTGAEREKVLQGFVLWWERPRDLSEVISRLLNDSYFGPKIDSKRIGVAGFSIGGYTALASVGARLEIEKWGSYCSDKPGDPMCQLPPEADYTTEELNNFLQSNADVFESRKYADNDFSDKRIRAAYVIAPVLIPIISAESLEKISVPVKIVAGEHDDQSVPEVNAIPVAKMIPRAKLLIIPKIEHYTFLSEGNLLGGILARKYVKDPQGIDRAEIHEAVGDDAAAFFDSSLDFTRRKG